MPSGYVFEHPESFASIPSERFGEVLLEMAQKHGPDSFEFMQLAGHVVATPAADPMIIGMLPLEEFASEADAQRQVESMLVHAQSVSGMYRRHLQVVDPTGQFYTMVHRGMTGEDTTKLARTILNKGPGCDVPEGWHRAPEHYRTLTPAGLVRVVGDHPPAIYFGPKIGRGHLEGVANAIGFEYEESGGRSQIEVHHKGKQVGVPTGQYVDQSESWPALFANEASQSPPVEEAGGWASRILGRLSGSHKGR